MVHRRHARWSKTGAWKRVFKALAQDAGNEYAMIDATIVRVHQRSAGAKRGLAIGRCRGGPSTTIHATVDALGNPTGFHLTPGQVHDLEGTAGGH
ncbi:Transposase [Dokdonella koreensis DS-123]|uniref:Transposase n=1 Tax=Dokdonella koreensis DS-123 TaxID=1300342 RepID=A0A160DU40_9GAMM|nr:Transposase [Dokdonella koreensis DS-123]